MLQDRGDRNMTINSFIYGGGIVDNTTLFQFSMMCKQMKEETNKQCNVAIMMLLVRREQIDSRLVESGLQYGITEKSSLASVSRGKNMLMSSYADE